MRYGAREKRGRETEREREREREKKNSEELRTSSLRRLKRRRPASLSPPISFFPIWARRQWLLVSSVSEAVQGLESDTVRAPSEKVPTGIIGNISHLYISSAYTCVV
ncbi:unnamed protein product [Gadus morhua 'NCC']